MYSPRKELRKSFQSKPYIFILIYLFLNPITKFVLNHSRTRSHSYVTSFTYLIFWSHLLNSSHVVLHLPFVLPTVYYEVSKEQSPLIFLRWHRGIVFASYPSCTRPLCPCHYSSQILITSNSLTGSRVSRPTSLERNSSTFSYVKKNIWYFRHLNSICNVTRLLR